MKKTFAKLILCVVALSTIATILSCRPAAPPPNVQNSPQNANTVETSSLLGADDACDEQNPSNKLTRIRGRIIDKMNKKLKDQHDEHKTFKFVVQNSTSGSYVEVYIEGVVYGSDQLKDLADALNDFKKKGCLLRVFFVPTGTIKNDGQPLRSVGFEWNACEWPEKACADGSCKENCIAMSNTNSSSNTGANSNSTTNSNSGTNSNGNTRSAPGNQQGP